jgi:hypothetical protein
MRFAIGPGIESNQVTAMPVTLPDELLQSTKLTEAELTTELALAKRWRQDLQRVKRLPGA